ncbi:MAG: dihydrolipoamide acetyltransferase family protein [Actinomycetia bacterium]|nr:dihydrolipoamide acetyltransferase family protein [Actinomycetes bacterium]
MSDVELVVPKWGLTMTEAMVIAWHKQPGEALHAGEPVVELETEKASADVEAPVPGTLARVLHEAGSTVAVGEVLAVIEAAAEEAPTVPTGVLQRAQLDPARSPVARTPDSRAAPQAAGPGRPTGSGRASPVARRLARELGIELSALEGTGARGLITERDVRQAAAGAAAPSPLAADVPPDGPRVAARQRLQGRRRAIGQALSAGLAESPQVTLTRTADVTGLVELKEGSGEHFSVNDFLIAATAATLRDHPQLNAHLVSEELWFFEAVNIGLAVDVEGGLIVPVLRDVQARSLDEIRARRLELVEGVRSGTTAPADLLDATFTITNLGAWGIDAFTPIINPPQVAILGVGRIEERPVAVSRTVGIRSESVLSLTFDHRALDGRPAAEFLADLSEPLGSRDRLAAFTGLEELASE